MKKLALGFIAIFILILCSTYIFIPSEIQISTVGYINCIPKNAVDCINDTTNWKQWWPRLNTPSSQGYKYNLIKRFSDGADILMRNANHSYHTRIRTMAIGTDSTAIEWQIDYSSGVSPIQRLEQRKEVAEIKGNTEEILRHIKSFAEKSENIYGFNVLRTTFTDTLLAAIKFSGKTYPTIGKVYGTIERIKAILSAQKIAPKGFPMLNVKRKYPAYYETMVAIPISEKPRPDKGLFVTRMVPMKDRFLFTQVTGGPSTLEKAHQAIEMYMYDHYLSAPAIPFEILVTDRSKQADTSNWKTLIYYPSM